MGANVPSGGHAPDAILHACFAGMRVLTPNTGGEEQKERDLCC